MIDLSRQQLLCLFSLVLSAFISLGLPLQDNDVGPRCLEGEKFEEKIQAVMMNRIQQMGNVLELTPGEMARLRVMVKGVIKEKLSNHQEKLAAPTDTATWKQYLEKALSEEQMTALNEFDSKKAKQRMAAKLRFESEPQTSAVHAEIAAGLLQQNLFLTDRQTSQILKMLNSYLERPETESGKATWQSFYDSNRDEIDGVLLESQLFFFQDQDALRMSKPLSSAARWQEASCADCHVAVGAVNQ